MTETTIKTYDFKVLNNDNKLEDWTGTFDSLDEAILWTNKHGITHINRNHILVLIEHLRITTTRIYRKKEKTSEKRSSRIIEIMAYTKNNPKQYK